MATPQELATSYEAQLRSAADKSIANISAAEYPEMADYLDAQVKKASADPAVRSAGEAQEAAYLAACQAIKAKYPKPA